MGGGLEASARGPGQLAAGACRARGGRRLIGRPPSPSRRWDWPSSYPTSGARPDSTSGPAGEQGGRGGSEWTRNLSQASRRVPELTTASSQASGHKGALSLAAKSKSLGVPHLWHSVLRIGVNWAIWRRRFQLKLHVLMCHFAHVATSPERGRHWEMPRTMLLSNFIRVSGSRTLLFGFLLCLLKHNSVSFFFPKKRNSCFL